MVDLNPYGRKGCSCFRDDPNDPNDTWYPNAACRFHGILADMLAPRDETGTYRVVPYPGPDPEADRLLEPEPPVEECPPGVHSMFDFCQGRAVCEEGFYPEDEADPMSMEDATALSEAMRDPDAPTRHLPPRPPEPYVCKIKEEERGYLATVRRWARHLADAWRGRPGWH